MCGIVAVVTGPVSVTVSVPSNKVRTVVVLYILKTLFR